MAGIGKCDGDSPDQNSAPVDDDSDLDRILGRLQDDPVAYAAYRDARARRTILLLLTKIREEKGITQAQVAEAIGISATEVDDLERGNVDPKLSVLQRYARAVGQQLTVDVVDDPGAI